MSPRPVIPASAAAGVCVTSSGGTDVYATVDPGSAYEFDVSSGVDHYYVTLTEDSVLTFGNLPSGDEVVIFSVDMEGDFVPSWSVTSWYRFAEPTYDGVLGTTYVFICTSAGVEGQALGNSTAPVMMGMGNGLNLSDDDWGIPGTVQVEGAVLSDATDGLKRYFNPIFTSVPITITDVGCYIWVPKPDSTVLIVILKCDDNWLVEPDGLMWQYVLDSTVSGLIEINDLAIDLEAGQYWVAHSGGTGKSITFSGTKRRLINGFESVTGTTREYFGAADEPNVPVANPVPGPTGVDTSNGFKHAFSFQWVNR